MALGVMFDYRREKEPYRMEGPGQIRLLCCFPTRCRLLRNFIRIGVTDRHPPSTKGSN